MPDQTPQKQEGYDLIRGLLEILPLLAFMAVGFTAWFNLQGQLIELRAKYESSTNTTKETLSALKEDVRETNVLLRQLNDEKRQQMYTLPGAKK
jgi:hypothetical protein